MQAKRERIKNKVIPPPEAIQRFQVNHVYDGTVEGVKRWGAFVELEGGVIGLLHHSEIAKDRSSLWTLYEGDRVKVRVVYTDAEKGRVGLSTRQQQQDADAEEADGEQQQQQPMLPGRR